MGGGGGGSKGGTPDVPTPPAPEPIPIREREVEAVEKGVRSTEQNRIKNLRGASGTILTSPLGTTGGAATGSSSILGKV